MKRVAIILGFLSIVTLICIRSNQGKQGDQDGAPVELQKICDKAMENIAKGEFKKGFSLVREYHVTPCSDNAFNTMLDHFGEQYKFFTDKFGKSTSYEFVGEKKVGDSLRRSTYIIKFGRNLMRYSFTFYRAEDTWKILASQFDDKYDELFK